MLDELFEEIKRAPILAITLMLVITVSCAFVISMFVYGMSDGIEKVESPVPYTSDNIIVISQDDLDYTGKVSVITFKDDLSTRCVITDHGGTYCYSIKVGK